MAKKKAEKVADGDQSARIKELEQLVKELRASLDATDAKLASQTALLERAREVISHVELSAMGIREKDVVIQHLIPCASPEEAVEMCQMMSQQEGYLVGKVRQNVAQILWEVDVAPATGMLFGLFSSLLQEGQRYCLVPLNFRPGSGITKMWRSQKPTLVEAAQEFADYLAHRPIKDEDVLEDGSMNFGIIDRDGFYNARFEDSSIVIRWVPPTESLLERVRARIIKTEHITYIS